jgi:hypothetical protein
VTVLGKGKAGEQPLRHSYSPTTYLKTVPRRSFAEPRPHTINGLLGQCRWRCKRPLRSAPPLARPQPLPAVPGKLRFVDWWEALWSGLVVGLIVARPGCRPPLVPRAPRDHSEGAAISAWRSTAPPPVVFASTGEDAITDRWLGAFSVGAMCCGGCCGN